MSLGKDLASIRKNKNLSLDDVQNAIKIPLDTLTSIEDDSIFSDPNRNKTYIRSFVRSYAKLLKIDDEDIVQALDEMEEGTYSGSIFPESSSSKTPPPPSKEEEPKTEATEISSPEEPAEKVSATPKKESVKSPKSETPEVATINWADMGKKFSTAGKNSPIWVIIISVVVIFVLGGTGYFFWDDISSIFRSDDNTEVVQQEPSDDQSIPIPPSTPDTSATQTPAEMEEQSPDETPRNQNPQPITLGDTLTVTVYAAYGQLEPVRVTSDLNWRTNPFWMEEGEAYYFDFSDSLLVRGQYSRLLLLFNGHVIENPRQNHFSPSFNSILITRSILDREQYLNPPPEEFPLEIGAPDSTVYRINF